MENESDLTFKMLTIGCTAVGKTALLLRITQNRFENTSMSTMGIDFCMKNIELDGKTIQVKIWDTAGQEKYENLTQQYYKNAQGILLVFDVNERESFEKVSDWMNEIKKANKINTQVVLVGNKIDLNERVVSKEEGMEKAEEYKIKYFETSAKTGENINELFEEIVKDLVKAFPPKVGDENDKFNCSATMVIHGRKPQKEKNGKCC